MCTSCDTCYQTRRRVIYGKILTVGSLFQSCPRMLFCLSCYNASTVRFRAHGFDSCPRLSFFLSTKSFFAGLSTKMLGPTNLKVLAATDRPFENQNYTPNSSGKEYQLILGSKKWHKFCSVEKHNLCPLGSCIIL